MKIIYTGGYLTFCLFFFAIIINNDRFASLTPGIEHVLKDVTYVTRQNK